MVFPFFLGVVLVVTRKGRHRKVRFGRPQVEGAAIVLGRCMLNPLVFFFVIDFPGVLQEPDRACANQWNQPTQQEMAIADQVVEP